MTNGNGNKGIAPKDAAKTNIILDVVHAFENAGVPVPQNFICGQRGGDDSISAFTLNVGDITEDGGRTASWKGNLSKEEMPTNNERKEIIREIKNKEEQGALYAGHCVPRTTPQSPAR